MSLEQVLLKEKTTLVKRWFDHVLATYPPETTKLFGKEPSQFANPVGHTIRSGMEGLYTEFLQGSPSEKLIPFLDRIIRIRAVQDFSPSQAIAFVFLLKTFAREIAAEEIRGNRMTVEDLQAFETKVDELALLAFNVYMECREKLYEVRVNEVKNRTYRLLQRANLIAELPGQKPESTDDNT